MRLRSLTVAVFLLASVALRVVGYTTYTVEGPPAVDIPLTTG